MAELDTDHLDLAAVQEFENLELLAKQVVEGFITGLHKSPYHGFSVEFAEHRLYNTGESTRHIDWKLYGRTEKLFVKRYEEETNLRCQLLIDNSSSMYYPEGGINKLQFSVYAAAALIQLLKKQRDATGMTIFSDRIEESFGARSNPVHLKLLYSALGGLLKEHAHNKTSSTTDVLHLIAESIHKRSLIVIFSDMMDNSSTEDQLFNALQHLKYNKHEVILFHVMDKKMEFGFEFENRPYRFVDIETGQEVKVFPSEVKEKYLDQVNKYRQKLQMKCTQYQIEYVEADINKGFRQVLLPFLLKRTRLY
ncbi:MAG: DUF58 domain-containing protein [Bacteroidia bacterium]